MIYIVHVMIRDLSARQDLDDEMGIYLIFPMCAPVTTAKMIPLKYEVRWAIYFPPSARNTKRRFGACPRQKPFSPNNVDLCFTKLCFIPQTVDVLFLIASYFIRQYSR